MAGIVTPPFIPATAAQVRALAATGVGLTPLSLTQRASFKATLSANQTGVADNTATKVQFNTEAWDVGAAYDNATNFRWTPPAGLVFMAHSLVAAGTSAAGRAADARILKNGGAFGIGVPRFNPGADEQEALCIMADNANGTDYYEAFGLMDVSAGDVTFVAQASCYFMGWQL